VTLTLYDKTLGGDVVQTIRLPRSGTPIKFEPDKRVVAPSSPRTVLYGHAGPNDRQVARVTLASRLVVEARRASMLRVALPEDRFAFVSASDVKSVAGTAKQSSGVKPVWNVVPPRLKLTPASHEAKSAVFKVHAQAFASGGVQDMWVRVWNPESKHRAVDKLVYRAAPKAGARQVEVSARVRLLPGTNYVAVDARDVGGAQGQRRIAVYLPKELAREGGDNLAGGTQLSAREKAARDKAASQKSKSKSGCGCHSSRSTSTDGATLLIGLLLLLGLWRRQRKRG
jgi:MYXO-CTERM domain-containing protein